MGVTNYVVQPQDWDERGKGVKNNRFDALALCQRLDRFTLGNRKAFIIVRVPSEDEEPDRAFTRQRQQIMREYQRLQAMGRSSAGLPRHPRDRKVLDGQDLEDHRRRGSRVGHRAAEGAHSIDRTDGGRGEGDDQLPGLD